jgi:hypothetical protein
MQDKKDYTIKEVTDSKDWYSISTTDSTGFGIKKKYGVVPKQGDIVTLYTKNFSTIRGIDLNGIRIFYKTDEELEQDRIEWLENHEREKQEKFKKNKVKMDKQYNNLPNAFKQRIDRFRANNPRFRIDYESYELFCCEQAIEIAKACKTPEEVKIFSEKTWEEQQKQVKKLSDGHSGNTFGCACRLAVLYLQNEGDVKKLHGSLSPLVGSEEYGDLPIVQ